MKKLIKISEFYYVIDTEEKIIDNDWVQTYMANRDLTIHKVKIDELDVVKDLNCPKIIATTNPNLNLPIIQNIEECEGLVDKEVHVSLTTFNSPKKHIIAIVKPIGKEEPIDATKLIEEVAKKMDYGKGVTIEEAMKRIDKFSEKEETIEEAAEKYANNQVNREYNYPAWSGVKNGVLFGANWQKEQDEIKIKALQRANLELANYIDKMYTEEEVKILLLAYNLDCITKGDNITTSEWFNKNKKK